MGLSEINSLALDGAGGIDDDFFVPDSPFDWDDLGLRAESPPDKYAHVYVPEVTEDDYAGEQLVAYLDLRKIVRLAVNVNSKWKQRRKALEWCFIPGASSSSGIDFMTACLALGARPHVIQARIQHQLYSSNIPLPEPLPFLAATFPEALANEVMMAAWENGLKFCRNLWNWPGIPANVMRESLPEMSFDEFRNTADKLEEAGFIALKLGCWFFITRNPERMSKRSFSWSKSILD